ncbi:Gfo/Idh/MocA family protein [Microbacterium tenebrionis]|uniref:Gfo/Idh/MocA family protein n=1 Tax=Microbacterium tenebrionis TaxID=2830665 RepID=UPI00158D49F9|nr:Gfo/Idh/MocA family oxidoreductase [Microbacterium ihumii]
MTGRRVLIVGAGAMGRIHAAAVRAAGDVINAVVDADTRRARTLDPGAELFLSVADALSAGGGLDAAVVATPSSAHLEQVRALAEAGVPVLVEKPHRVPGEDPSSLLEAERRGARVFVGMSTRHWPGIEAAADAVRAGELGEILAYTDRMAFRLAEESLPAWYFDAAVSGGGILVTNGVHALDRVRSILGAPTIDAAEMRRIVDRGDVEEMAVLRGTVDRSAVLIELLWTGYPPLGEGLVISGTRGAASVRMDGSWCITTQGGERNGPAIDLDVTPFRRQWTAFTNAAPGFSVRDLEPTLTLIESIYREHSDD